MICKHKFIVIAVAALLCATVVCGVIVAFADVGVQLYAIGFEQKDYYVVGETLEVGNVQLTDGNNRYECDKLVTYPSGVTRRGDSFVLGESGQYVLKLQTMICGQYRIVKKTLYAVESYCSLISDSSTATLTDDGYKISLSNGDTVTFNKVFDVSDYTSANSLIKLKILPTISGEADFTVLNITFTDVNDPDSTLRFRLRGYQNGTYGLVGSTYQPLTGYEPEWDRLHKDNQWGAFSPMVNFYGFAGTSAIVDIRFDNETKQAYFTPTTVIADLDDPRQFANVWDGFTSGKVNVSVSASDYNGRFAVFEITEIGGEKPSSQVYSDSDAPEITVNEQLPEAQVGIAYPLPVATANDARNGDVAVGVAVYKNYYGLNRYNVTVKNNCFIPDEEGNYFVEYKAADRAGNVATKVVEVTAVANLPELAITVDDIGAITVGDVVKLPACTASGGSGRISISVSVTCDGSDVDVTEGVFTVRQMGNYVVKYAAMDYIGNTATKQIEFAPIVANRAKLNETIVLPKYMITGKTYCLPRVSVTDYSEGHAVVAECQVYIVTPNGERRLSDFVYTPTDEGDLRFVYKYNNLITESVTVKSINVGTQGSLNMAKYFVSNSGTIDATEDGIEFVSFYGSATMEFIRPLLSDDLMLRFAVDPEKSNYDAVEVALVDSEDPDKIVRLGFAKNGKGVSVYLNGEYKSRLLGFGFGVDSPTNTFSVGFDGSVLVPYTDVNIKVDKFADGIPFDGFSSGRVYVSFNFVGNHNGKLIVKNIGGQLLNDSGYDRMRPQIVICGDYGGECALNEIIGTATASAEDVLDPTITFTVSVKLPDGNYATSVDGILLKDVSPLVSYKFKVEMYGNYVVAYSAADSHNGKSADRSYSVLCEDKTQPQVTIKESSQSIYRLGDIVALPEYEVSDNVTEVKVFVTSPGGVTVAVTKAKDGFVVDRCGVWVVAIVVYDANGNMACAKIVLEVTK